LRECVAVEGRVAPRYIWRVQKRIQHQRSASTHRVRLAIPWRLAACSTTWWPRWGGALLLRGGGAPVGEWQEAIEWDGAILRRCHPQYAAENAARAAGARAAVVRENARGRDGDADVQREMQMYMPTHMHRERGRGPQKTIEPSALSLGSGSPCAISSFSTPCSSTSTVPNSGRWSATSDQQRAMSRSRRSGT